MEVKLPRHLGGLLGSSALALAVLACASALDASEPALVAAASTPIRASVTAAATPGPAHLVNASPRAGAVAPTGTGVTGTGSTTTVTTGPTESDKTRYLLALGDSLAAGYQPVDGTSPPPVDPADGVADEGYPGGYADDLAQRYGLKLVDLACPGETTASFDAKPAQAACTTFYQEWLGEADQEQAALHFLDLHPRQVALLTIDLGANDLDDCTRGGSVQLSCLLGGESDIVSQLPHLLATLAAGLGRDDPGTRIVAMDYYDPFLALSFSPGGAKADAEAVESLAGVATLNTTVSAIDARHGVLTAGVAKAFQSTSVLPLTRYDGRELPRNVATVCRLTWMCPLPGSSDQQANIHPRLAGYRTIAAAFESVLEAHGIRP